MNRSAFSCKKNFELLCNKNTEKEQNYRIHRWVKLKEREKKTKRKRL